VAQRNLGDRALGGAQNSGNSSKSSLDSGNRRDRLKVIFTMRRASNLMGCLSWLQRAMEKLYSVRDIQRLFGFKAGKIRYWDKMGFLTPSVKIGARKYYTTQDLIGLRTAKGLLDAGLSFAKVRRSVIDVKKISSGGMKPLSLLLIYGGGKESVFDPETLRFKARAQSLIGFSQGDFERGMQSANTDINPELEESGTARETTPGKRGSVKPENP